MDTAPGPVTLLEPAHPPSRKAPLLWAVGAAIPWLVLGVAQLVWFALDRRLWWLHAAAAAAEDRARSQGAAKVTLRVLGTNTAARGVYERAGYVVEGRLRGEFRIDGVDVDDLLLARYLGTADS